MIVENNSRQFVLSMLAYCAQVGLSPKRLGALTGIDVNELETDPDKTITHKQLDMLWSNAIHLTRDPLFGLHFGESLRLPALGVVGSLIQSSKTVGEALRLAADHLNLIADLFRLEITLFEETFSLVFIADVECKKEYPVAYRQGLDLSMVFAMYELQGLVLKKISPLSVKLPYASLENPEEYERVLGCKPSLNSNTLVMSFDITYWDEPIITANYELQKLLLQKVSQYKQTTNQPQSLKERILDHLFSNSYLGIPTLYEISSNFNTHPRTLQRKLKNEGITYQELTEKTRKSLALYYLRSGTHQIKEISYMLGYNEISAFTRAFKRWTGQSPANYLQA